ncbi:MAG TPA: glycogen/starch synthase [Candidatus Bacteroides avicola]|mgnify:FL=1|jgi:glycosyltransferase involved in cell wall biosynthesis|uniref:Glycogen/starch synthase n=1 Tax=Candidatus Bacteroides avicola TaxID=2838468 RepID=A0A9D2HYX6_9BACE|nr:glycogen/starch synthase [Mediterranea sp. An20]MBW9201867.1 glycosyl transferase [Bacteroidales bacterium SW292]OUP09927.1 glycosyl transferase [Mediterranea sp. An20]HJA86921.1 glycogen/starch synthase [Candidatus Bacteroides avicola]
MIEGLQTPDYVFAASWEVCNKVGGIYTVLSTQANTLQAKFHDRLFYIGPDFWQGKDNPLFIESDNLCAAWRQYAIEKDHLKVRVGRWNIPGEPIVFLVDFQQFYSQKNDIYTDMWNRYQVDSLHAYGDYDESSMFAFATGKVVESFYRFNLTETDKVVFQAHEWMTGMAALYLQTAVPEIATVFTTHATSIGRSIAGNNKPLYDYLFAYNGDQMAQELNMQSKHSIEKQTAHYVDCFTTVSEITNNECKELLDKPADVILMNGFEDDFVPKGSTYAGKRKRARSLFFRLANCLIGEEFDDDTLIVGTSGRYEFKNKGIDVFLEAMNRLNRDRNLKKKVLAMVSVPGWVGSPREDLLERMKSKEKFTTPLPAPLITHWLHNMTHDQVLDMLKYLDLNNRPQDPVKVIFVPCYLDGKDGIINKHYYDLIVGEDLTIYPSYYEPWGYTPLESVAFHVPTITTDLAGFGLWVNSLRNQHGIEDGVQVLHRSDYNYSEVADGIKDTVSLFSNKSEDEVKVIRRRAGQVAEQALWKYFIQYYYEAYDIALRNAMKRLLNGQN